MKTKIFISALLSFSFYLLSSQVPQGFNYQAIALDGTTPISTSLPVRITIQSDPAGGTIFWVEEHASVIPNSSGLFSLVVGSGVRQAASTVAAFSDIDWSVSPKYIKTEINYGGWRTMGASGLWAVPYSMLAKDLQGPVKKLGVAGTTTNLEEALFEVKNNNGQTIFAVYNEGVRIYVDDGSKGAKGGFAIGGFDIAKAPGQEYLRVTRDSTRVYVNQPAKGAKGGFAIGGFSGAKATVDNFLDLTKENYFIGHQAGYKNNTGQYNSFIGYTSGYSNISGLYNTMIGYESGYSADASYNTFFGYQAGKNTSSGQGNLFMGYTTGFSNTTGFQNVFLGYNSGKYNISGYRNTFVGSHAGYGFNGGTANIMMGFASGNYFYGGDNNILLGNESGYGIKNSTNMAYNNIFIGTKSGRLITTGTDNAIIGTESGYNNSTGYNNVFIGNRSGYSNTGGYNNIFIGFKAGENAIGNTNSTFIGNEAGKNITGDDNISVGDRSGTNAWVTNYEAFGLAILGIDAGRNITGSYNTILGYGAGSKWGGAGTGSNNVFVGSQAGSGGSNFIGDNNICIGNQAGFDQTGSNKLFIENSDAGPTAALIYGDFLVNYLRFNANTDIYGNLAIGKSSASAKLDILGGNWDVLNSEGDFRIGSGIYRFKIGVATAGGGSGDVRMTAHGGTSRLILGGAGKDILSVTSTDVLPYTDNAINLGLGTNRWKAVYSANGTIQTSDARYKDNIHDLNYGLESILNLHPVSFSWIDDPEKNVHLGLIAQDVEKVVNEVVDKGTDQKQTLGINYSGLVPVLIKGMQEQQMQIESAKQENIQLKSELQSLNERMMKLEALLTATGNK